MLLPSLFHSKFSLRALFLIFVLLTHHTASYTIPQRSQASVSFSELAYNDDNHPTPKPPVHFAVLLPRGFSALDVFGPLEVFQALSRTGPNSPQLRLSFLARSLNEPVTTEPPFQVIPNNLSPKNNDNSDPYLHPKSTDNSTSTFPLPPRGFHARLLPTHTYSVPPQSIDVLLVPGGAAARSPDLGTEIEFIRAVFPKLQYLITICTGAGIAAQAGVLDGRRATTNKAAWGVITAMGREVRWVSPARWVDDGKVWSSSGVTAGIDLAFAFIKAKYPNGTAIAEDIAGHLEHTIIDDWRDDPWADYYGVPPQN